MDESDLQSLYAILADHFKEQGERLEGDLQPDYELRGVFGDDGQDMGVTAYKDKTYEELSTLLAFPEGRPPLFCKYRSMDTTINSWVDEESPQWTQGGDGLIPLALKWHQLCGVASMVDKMFVGNKATGTNICLSDDVGLGKSAQIMGVIAFIIVVWVAQRDKQVLPPIIGALLFMVLSWQSWKATRDRGGVSYKHSRSVTFQDCQCIADVYSNSFLSRRVQALVHEIKG